MRGLRGGLRGLRSGLRGLRGGLRGLRGGLRGLRGGLRGRAVFLVAVRQAEGAYRDREEGAGEPRQRDSGEHQVDDQRAAAGLPQALRDGLQEGAFVLCASQNISDGGLKNAMGV